MFTDAAALPTENLQDMPRLADFWAMSAAERESIVLRAITKEHLWHFERNKAYRCTVTARGIGPVIGQAELPRLLRPTSQTLHDPCGAAQLRLVGQASS
jgi:hypothetical protein